MKIKEREVYNMKMLVFVLTAIAQGGASTTNTLITAQTALTAFLAAIAVVALILLTTAAAIVIVNILRHMTTKYY